MSTGGPRNNPEKAPKSKYPKFKRNEDLKCLGCTNGKVMAANGRLRDCTACKGTGNITAK